MPAGNRMGPAGMGPRTGRGMGYCAGYSTPGYMNPGGGNWGGGYWGAGRGAWGGRGYRNWFYATGQPGWARAGYPAGAYPVPAPMSEEEEAQALSDQEKWLEDQLKDVRSRMKKSGKE